MAIASLFAPVVLLSGCFGGSDGSSPAQTAATQTTVSQAGECDPTLGCFTDPFVEPMVYTRAAGDDDNPNLQGIETPEKCIYDDGTQRNLCKPAAGTISLLPNGDFLYFNALEGTEDFDTGILVDFGQDAINDQTRVMRIPRNGEAATSWVRPGPVDAGANREGYQITELIPGLTNTNTNGADGALFCADVAAMPDGRILAVGGTAYYSEPGLDGLDVGLVELEGLRNSRAFNPNTNTWTQMADMNFGRWYPSTVTLADSKVFVASGVTKLLKPVYPQGPEQSGRNVVQTETFDITANDGMGEWTDNGENAQRTLPLYPRLHLLPNGHVYYNAGGQAFNPFGQSYDQALWNIAATYNPGTKNWSDLAYAGFPFKFSEAGLANFTKVLNIPTAPTTAVESLAGILSPDTLMKTPQELQSTIEAFAGTENPELLFQQLIGSGMRGSTFSVQLPLKPNEEGKYTDASFLTAGGVLTYVTVGSPGGYFAVSSSRIDTVKTELADDIAEAKVVGYESEVTGPLNETRWYGTGVLLPDESVMVFSGGDRDGVAAPGVEFPRKRAERFDPVTKTWSPMAEATQPRTYHNTALLMRDGRVLVGGHAPISTLYVNNIDLAALGFSPNDGRDPSFEIYSPPYMFKDRPTLASVNGVSSQNGEQITLPQVVLGDAVNLQLGGGTSAESIDSVALVRHTAMTHLIDGDQRTVIITKDQLSGGGDELSFALPTQPALSTEGTYMAFVRIKDAEGNLIPSEAQSFMIKH